jgi:hypothetical protein
MTGWAVLSANRVANSYHSDVRVKLAAVRPSQEATLTTAGKPIRPPLARRVRLATPRPPISFAT